MTTALLKQVDSLFDIPALQPVLDLAGRAALSSMFILAGVNKIQYYDGNVAFMESGGLPGALMPLVILLELGGGLALLTGFQTRLAALALSIFTVAAAIIFHSSDDMIQGLLYMKNIALAGGLLFIAARGAGHLSIDARLFGKGN